MTKTLNFIDTFLATILDIITKVIFHALQGKFGDLQLKEVYLPYYRIILALIGIKMFCVFYDFIYPTIEFVAKIAMCFRN